MSINLCLFHNSVVQNGFHSFFFFLFGLLSGIIVINIEDKEKKKIIIAIDSPKHILSSLPTLHTCTYSQSSVDPYYGYHSKTDPNPPL